mgnify:CR=1 FL=1
MTSPCRAWARSRAEGLQLRRDHEEEDENAVVEREDAERPSRIEATEVALRAPRAPQDARDEVAREHEEEVDGGPAQRGQEGERLVERTRREAEEGQVVEHHRKNREAAEAIEPGIPDFRFGRSVRSETRHGRRLYPCGTL